MRIIVANTTCNQGGVNDLAKPDDRTDNVERIQHSISNTIEHMREAEDFVRAHDDEMDSRDKAEILAKNHRREDAVQGFREEIRDESKKQ